MNLSGLVTASLIRHPSVTGVELVGSRQRGDDGALSDWDFEVKTADFELIARDLPRLLTALEPLAQQWDRLSEQQTYMLILRGAVKVDLIFDAPHKAEPPWTASHETLRRIDDHFWDWMIWLASKDRRGKLELVRNELQKLHRHLLSPLGIEDVPRNINAAIQDFTINRDSLEQRFRVAVDRTLELEIRAALRSNGYAV